MDAERLAQIAALLKDGFIAGAKDFGADARNVAQGNMTGTSFENRRAVMPTTFDDRFAAAPASVPQIPNHATASNMSIQPGGAAPAPSPPPQNVDVSQQIPSAMLADMVSRGRISDMNGPGAARAQQEAEANPEYINEILKRLGQSVPQNAAPGSTPYVQ